MKKAILIILTVGILGYIAYWLFTRYKKGSSQAAGNTAPQPAPPETVPASASGSLVDPTTGAGLAAISRRIGELKGTAVAAELESKVRQAVNPLTGVTASKSAYYNQNIARKPITSAQVLPLDVPFNVQSALQAFASIDPKAGAATTAALRNANQALFDVSGTAFVGDPELSSQDAFDKQVVCQGYQNCGKKYRDIAKELPAGAEKAANDQAKIAGAWLAMIHTFDSELMTRAIEDLRGSGWKFIGYDH